MTKPLTVISFLVVIGIVLLSVYPINKDQRNAVSYASNRYGLSFQYPHKYFVALERTFDGEREQRAVVLAEDTTAVRELFSNPKFATEGPPTITVTIFQNNLDHYTLQSFVEGTNFSNFKLSDGKKSDITVGGETAWRYHATGLYENEHVVIVRPDYVYMFTVSFNSPDDQIPKDFDAILKTVVFTKPNRGTSISVSGVSPESIRRER